MPDDASKPPASPSSKSGGRRFWLTIGEVIAVLSLAVAGLNFWENHRDRQQALEREAQAAKAQAQAQSRSVFLMRGEADEAGERVILQPTNAGQVVQTQRYLFPKAVLDHGKEIGTGRLQIDLAWFDDGLRKALKAARKEGSALPKGEAALPIGVVTTYVENGETRTDQSIYRVGYVAEPKLLGAVKLKLLGVTVVRRGVSGDLQAAVDVAWKAQTPG